VRNPKKLNITTLDGKWSDKDNVMLHACFQLLTDFVEQEIANDIADWQHDDAHSNARKEIDELYAWWKQRIIKDNAGEIDSIWGEGQYETDNAMLIRLINIRKYLWT